MPLQYRVYCFSLIHVYKYSIVDSQRINFLLEKYTAGTINAFEKQELLNLYNSTSSEDGQFPDDRQTASERMLDRLNREINRGKYRSRSSSAGNFRRISAAAIVLIICAAGVYLLNQSKTRELTVNHPIRPVQMILPGSNMAVLTLGNGKRIVLNSASNGKLATQGKTIITKNTAGQISYLAANEHESNLEKEPVTYNTVSTPSGGQFQVVLPDGTNVWLNAASTLKFPNRFEGSERHVELTGEAYFEVFKNKNVPFTVNAGNVNIKVLGTHFNVMAYKNEPAVKTTLLEGSVVLNSRHSQALLTPGMQAVVGPLTDNIVLQQINVADAVAWKNGYFSFRKENLQTAMNKIARWYNVDVEYTGNVNHRMLGGTVSRAENITELLNYLELTGVASFRIEGRRIFVLCK